MKKLVKIKVDSTEVHKTEEKLIKLVDLLKEAKTLVDELASVEINLNIKV